ncbi:MAG: hypothetical protein KDK91_07180, partial [Gammaproteobacteria bacterium]|nr:hypothetical protein [Gammaproteobacteria bacterium]
MQGAGNVATYMMETLLERGVAADLIALELNRFLHGTTVYSDCWVLDKPWLTRLFEAAGTSPGFWLSPIELIITEPQLLGWASIRDQVVLDLGLTRHRASADALIVQETWVRSQAA